MVLGVAAFSAHDMVGKLIVEEYPVAQMLAMRAAVAWVLLLVVVRRQGGVPPLRRGSVVAHAIRLLSMLGAIFLFFTAIRDLPLADATAIAFGAPFVMLALSAPVLGERVPAGAWGAVAAGFAGVVIVVRPTGDGIEPAALLAVGASVLYAVGMLTTRKLGGTESELNLIFWMVSGQLLVALAVVPFVWEPVSLRHWPLVVALAVLNLLGQVGLTRAFARAPVSVVAPFEYVALLWAAALGFIVFGDVPSVRVWVGAAIIVGAGTYATLRTRAGASSVTVP